MCTEGKIATENKKGKKSVPWVKSVSVGMQVRLGNDGLTKYRGNGDICALREGEVEKRKFPDFPDRGFSEWRSLTPMDGGCQRVAEACFGSPLWQNF